MKIIPKIVKDPEIEIGSDDNDIVESLRQYIETNSLILDLIFKIGVK